MKLLLIVAGLSLVIGEVTPLNHTITAPAGPQGPPGAKQVYDLLDLSWGHMGAFIPKTWPKGKFNSELQEYTPDACQWNSGTGEITITAKKEGSKITSGRLDTNGVWSTSQSDAIKKRGYVEVRATLPVRPNGKGKYEGAWPAIWMLGRYGGWPREGEIDIVEAVNGDPSIYYSLHSTNHHGANPQHPPNQPKWMNSNLDESPLIAGLEWNVQDKIGQIDITWWMSWFDLGSGSWQKQHTTFSMFAWGNQDYIDFHQSFLHGGFYLIVNLAQGGNWPSNNVFPDGKPQYMHIKSAKVYGF